jgi:hypothetical protein
MTVSVDLFGFNREGEVKTLTVKVKVPDDGYTYRVIGETREPDTSIRGILRSLKNEKSRI